MIPAGRRDQSDQGQLESVFWRMDRQQGKAGCLAILRLREFQISASWMNVKTELFVVKLKKNAFAILATMVFSASWMLMNVSGNDFSCFIKQKFSIIY